MMQISTRLLLFTSESSGITQELSSSVNLLKRSVFHLFWVLRTQNKGWFWPITKKRYIPKMGIGSTRNPPWTATPTMLPPPLLSSSSGGGPMGDLSYVINLGWAHGKNTNPWPCSRVSPQWHQLDLVFFYSCTCSPGDPARGDSLAPGIKPLKALCLEDILENLHLSGGLGTTWDSSRGAGGRDRGEECLCPFAPRRDPGWAKENGCLMKLAFKENDSWIGWMVSCKSRSMESIESPFCPTRLLPYSTVNWYCNWSGNIYSFTPFIFCIKPKTVSFKVSCIKFWLRQTINVRVWIPTLAWRALMHGTVKMYKSDWITDAIHFIQPNGGILNSCSSLSCGHLLPPMLFQSAILLPEHHKSVGARRGPAPPFVAALNRNIEQREGSSS